MIFIMDQYRDLYYGSESWSLLWIRAVILIMDQSSDPYYGSEPIDGGWKKLLILIANNGLPSPWSFMKQTKVSFKDTFVC